MAGYAKIMRQYLGQSIAFAIVAIIVATAGYVGISDYPVFDAVYMTVITMGTIGFAEIRPLSTTGRLWTMFVILLGYTALINMTARLTTLLMSGSFTTHRDRLRRSRMLKELSNHVIVVGFGRVGRSTVEAAISAGRDCVVIDNIEEHRVEIEAAQAIAVIGDARDLDVLESAGIERAASLITTLPDPDNIVVVTSARFRLPQLRIVSRVNDVEWCGRLQRAGADDLVPVYASAGRHLATSAVTPGVLGVLSAGGDAITEEILVNDDSPVIGRSIAQLMAEFPSVVILGIQRDNSIARWHEITGALSAGDVVIVRGPVAGLGELVNALSNG